MTNAQHTPATWRLQPTDNLDGRIAILGHGGNRTINVADLYNCNDANARLIAAAPELLEALEEAVPFLIMLGDFIGNGIESPRVTNSLGIRCDALLKMRAAIAKATEGA